MFGIRAVGISRLTSIAAAVAAYTKSLVLSLKGDSNYNKNQNKTALDRSVSDLAISPSSTPPEMSSFSPFSSTASYYFDGSGDYLSIPTSTAFGFGTGDFSMECLVNTSSNNFVFFDWRTSLSEAGTFFQNPTGVGYYDATVGGLNTNISINDNKWHHVAISRSSGTLRIFIDGTQQGSWAVTTNHGATRPLKIGAAYDNSTTLAGYISNVRVVKGTAIYTAAFTPPTTALTAVANTSLLTCHSVRMFDGSTNAATISVFGDTKASTFSPFDGTTPSGSVGSTSVYFDGTGDYLSIARNAAFFPAANTDFTIEAWVYLTATPGATTAQIIGTGEYGTDADWNLTVNSSLVVQSYIQSTNTVYTGGTITLNSWNHVAISRSGTGANNLKIFVNGVGTSYSMNGTLVGVGTRALTLGGDVNGDESNLTGYISNARIVNGTAVYTANFTPPTAELTAVSGTALLTCQGNTTSDSSSNNATITVAGNSRVSSRNPFGSGSGWSGYFDGTGDYLTIPSSAALNVLGGDLTIECWFNPTSFNASGYNYLIMQDDGGSDSQNFQLKCSAAGVVEFTSWNTSARASAFTVSSIRTATLSAWNHIAVTHVKSTNTTRLFLNGVLEATSTTAMWAGSTQPTCIGNWNNGLGIQNATYSKLNGYISNVRMVKGTALYTAAFTPSTSPLTAVANTSLLTLQDNIFKDNSSNAFAITSYGDAAIRAVGPFGATAMFPGSVYFNQQGYYTTSASAALNVCGGNFTIECWYNPVNFTNLSNLITSDYASSASSGNFQLYVTTGGVVTFKAYNTSTSSSAFTVSSIRTAKLGAWQHIAVTHVKSTNTTRLFLDGVLEASSTTAIWAGTTLAAAIGGRGQPGSLNDVAMKCSLSGVRVIKGTALYTAGFTPPTSMPVATADTVLLLNFNDGAVIDATGQSSTKSLTLGSTVTSSTTKKFGTGSVYFDGASEIKMGPNVSGASPPEFTFGTSDFTIEFWVNPSVANTRWLYDGRPFGGNGAYVALSLSGAENALGVTLTVNSVAVITTKSISLNSWTHVALVRSSGVTKIYLDGIQSGSSWSDSTNYLNADTGRPWIGQSTNAGYFTGYLDDIRVYKGLAKYTSTFLPSENESTVPSPSSFSWAIYRGSSTNSADDGSALTAASTSALALGTGDFTMEAWINVTGNNTGYVEILKCAYTGASCVVRFGNSGYGYKLQAAVTTASTSTVWSCSVLQSSILGAWTHIAFTRSSGVCRLFVNGVVQSINSGANPSTYPYTSFTDTTSVGNSSLAVGTYLIGYITDARIVKGTALYTADFTPPSSKLTAVSGTAVLTAQDATAIDNSSNALTITAGARARATTTYYKY